MAVMCIELHCLPHPGGLYDQDSVEVVAIKAVMSGRAEKAKMEERRASQR